MDRRCTLNEHHSRWLISIIRWPVHIEHGSTDTPLVSKAHRRLWVEWKSNELDLGCDKVLSAEGAGGDVPLYVLDHQGQRARSRIPLTLLTLPSNLVAVQLLLLLSHPDPHLLLTLHLPAPPFPPLHTPPPPCSSLPSCSNCPSLIDCACYRPPPCPAPSTSGTHRPLLLLLLPTLTLLWW